MVSLTSMKIHQFVSHTLQWRGPWTETWSIFRIWSMERLLPDIWILGSNRAIYISKRSILTILLLTLKYVIYVTSFDAVTRALILHRGYIESILLQYICISILGSNTVNFIYSILPEYIYTTTGYIQLYFKIYELRSTWYYYDFDYYIQVLRLCWSRSICTIQVVTTVSSVPIIVSVPGFSAVAVDGDRGVRKV